MQSEFLSKVSFGAPTECWLWTGRIDLCGYGRWFHEGTDWAAHRWAYEIWIGPIPAGLEIDHVRSRGCTNRHCVNPAHLEAVTHAENMRRLIRSVPTVCVNGHPYDDANTYLRPAQSDHGRPRRPQCRTCNGEAVARYKRKVKTA